MWDKKIVTWKELGLSKQIILTTLLGLHFIIVYVIAVHFSKIDILPLSLAASLFFMFMLEYFFMHAIRMLNYYDGKQGFFMFLLSVVGWMISLIQLY